MCLYPRLYGSIVKRSMREGITTTIFIYVHKIHALHVTLQLTFNDWTEVPLVNELSIGVAPGTQNAIAVKRMEVCVSLQ